MSERPEKTNGAQTARTWKTVIRRLGSSFHGCVLVTLPICLLVHLASMDIDGFRVVWFVTHWLTTALLAWVLWGRNEPPDGRSKQMC